MFSVLGLLAAVSSTFSKLTCLQVVLNFEKVLETVAGSTDTENIVEEGGGGGGVAGPEFLELVFFCSNKRHTRARTSVTCFVRRTHNSSKIEETMTSA